jgi:ATP-dependent DNA ligase
MAPQITDTLQEIKLYQKDHIGNIRIWTIAVEPSFLAEYDIIIHSGIVGGKHIETRTPISEGTNIGKSNEKSPFEQALFDAQTEINKKVKAGYVSNISDIKDKSQSATILKPSKGNVYHPTGANNGLTLKRAKFTDKYVGIQMKLDGWRYRIHVCDDIITFYTSSGDIALPFEYIEWAVLHKSIDFYQQFGISEFTLDGEIYNHELGYQTVASVCGTTKHFTEEKKKLRDEMQFFLFDITGPEFDNLPYKERLKYLTPFVDNQFIMPLSTLCFEKGTITDELIKQCFEEALKVGYEGLIIRDMDATYQHRKCNQFLKYKPLLDDEFEIVDFVRSITGETLGALVLQLPDGRRFNCDLKGEIGTDASKQKIWNNRKDYIGKFVTVEFLEYTKDGIPRNLKAKGFRKGKSLD